MTDAHDRLRFLQMLAHFNDEATRENWIDDLERDGRSGTFDRASLWDEKKPLVSIHAFCVHDNHFHLLLEEIQDGGVTAFMRKLGTGFVGYLNARHGQHGSPFQGAYKSKTIDTDVYLRYVFAYIQVKNVFELLPRGYMHAAEHFDASYVAAADDPRSSLYDYERATDKENRGILSHELFTGLWTPKRWRAYARDVIEGRAHLASHQQQATRGYFV